MDIDTEIKKAGGSSFVRYGLLFIGLVIFFFSQGVLNWKSTSARDAAGKVDAIQLKISKLDKEVNDSDNADEKKDLREEIKDLRENDLEDARLDAVSEDVDSKNGIWFWSMVNHLGATVLALGLLVIAVTGCTHEKIGSLVALGILIAST